MINADNDKYLLSFGKNLELPTRILYVSGEILRCAQHDRVSCERNEVSPVQRRSLRSPEAVLEAALEIRMVG